MLPEEDLTFPFGKDQFECLPFRSPDGFSAVYLDLIEGFCANSNGTTAIFLRGSGLDAYNSTESVPQLVKRFNFFMEKRRLREEKVVEIPAYPQGFVPVQGDSHALNAPEAESPQGLQEEAVAETSAETPLLTQSPGEEVRPPPANGASKPFPFRVPSRA